MRMKCAENLCIYCISYFYDNVNIISQKETKKIAGSEKAGDERKKCPQKALKRHGETGSRV